jgi:hypothetical protein
MSYTSLLTQRKLADQLAGLGLSTDVRADVARACKKISQRNHCGTISTRFSTYCTGAAPTMADLERSLEHPPSELTWQEIESCRIFIAARKAVGEPKASQRNRWAPRHETRRPPLHSFGSLRSTLPPPSRGSGFWR